MPSAPPSSVPVSDSPDAWPAFSGGTAPTMTSVASVTTGETPSPSSAVPASVSGSPCPPCPGSCVRISSPAAATAKP